MILLGAEYQFQLEEKAKRDFELIPIALYATVFPIFIGLLLRVPKMILEKKQNKQWAFDWVKFTAVALPCVYILTISLLPYFSFAADSMHVPLILMIASPTIQTIAGIVLGYTFLDSLHK